MATTRPARGKKEKLLRLIECPICLNELQDPRLLSCRHTLCYTCVRDYTEKGDYSNQLPCPVCRGVTVLYQGGVDNLPKFFFMNELKEVVTERDDEDDIKSQQQGGPVCFAEDCGQLAVKYCKDGCQFLCQQCFDDHQTFKLTRNHAVIPAIEGEVIIKSKHPPYPPCNRHKHQVLDLFCQTCNLPICNTCSNSSHRGHDCCELEEQADICRTKLDKICKDTDELIHIVERAMDKTKHQVQKAETDINRACDNVKSTFKKMHEKLTEEEEEMLSDLQEARSRAKKTADSTIDSQTMTLARLESLKSCEIKLVDKGSPYDYVTVTESMQRDVEDHYGQQLPGFMWNCQFVNEEIYDLCYSREVEMKVADYSNTYKEIKEVGRICLQNHQESVLGLVVYKDHIYTVHLTNFTVYCFAKDGTLCSKYEHIKENTTQIQGMCLMMDGKTAMLVVSDDTNDALVWIKINEDFTMGYHKLQQLDYTPRGSYDDRGVLMICEEVHHKIHRYSGDGQPLDVITLPDDAIPSYLARYGNGDQYIVVDYENKHVLVINNKGQVKTRYKDEIQGVKLGDPCDVIRDTEGKILITDDSGNRILLLNKEGNKVMQLLQQQRVMDLTCLYIDDDHHRLYVTGKDQDEKQYVFIYDSTEIGSDKHDTTLREIVTRIDLKVKL